MGGWLERLLLEGSGDPRARWAAGALVLLGAACLVAVTCSGCGGVPERARHAVHAGAVVLVEVDRVAAEEYRDGAAAALEASSSLAEYREQMRALDGLQVALQGAAAALEVADALLAVWDGAAEQRWGEVIAALFDAYEGVLRALRAADIEPPDGLFRFLGGIFTQPGEG